MKGTVRQLTCSLHSNSWLAVGNSSKRAFDTNLGVEIADDKFCECVVFPEEILEAAPPQSDAMAPF